MRMPCQPVIQEWELQLARLVVRATEPSLDDPSQLCRDDRCPQLAPHEVHPIIDEDEDLGVYDDTGLVEMTLGYVAEREVRTAGQIYTSLCDDYGYVNYRTVQVALCELAKRREVVLVLPRHTRRRLVDPLALSRKGGVAAMGAWIRYSSPLLFQCDGYDVLSSQVEELCIDRKRLNLPTRRDPRGAPGAGDEAACL